MSPTRKPPAAPAECPVCGADVPRGARACPECGADERTGWDAESTRYDGLDLPEEAFDDHDTGAPAGRRRGASTPGMALFWWGVAIVVLVAVVVGLVLRFR